MKEPEHGNRANSRNVREYQMGYTTGSGQCPAHYHYSPTDTEVARTFQ